jgi:hypothetical protein
MKSLQVCLYGWICGKEMTTGKNGPSLSLQFFMVAFTSWEDERVWRKQFSFEYTEFERLVRYLSGKVVFIKPQQFGVIRCFRIFFQPDDKMVISLFLTLFSFSVLKIIFP